MQQPNEFSAYRAELLEDRYDCVDRTRRHLDVPRLRTLLGQKNRPHQCLGKKTQRLAWVLDQPAYDLIVFKVRLRPLTLKLYDKGARVLRIEATAHNNKGLRCGKSLEKLPIMLAELRRMVIDFH